MRNKINANLPINFPQMWALCTFVLFDKITPFFSISFLCQENGIVLSHKHIRRYLSICMSLSLNSFIPLFFGARLCIHGGTNCPSQSSAAQKCVDVAIFYILVEKQGLLARTNFLPRDPNKYWVPGPGSSWVHIS